LTIPLSGDQQVPPVDTNVTGTATLTVGDGVIGYTFQGENPSSVGMFGGNGATINCGPANETGPVIVQLVQPIENGVSGNSFAANGVFTDAEVIFNVCGTGVSGVIGAIQAGQAYINVNSVAHPDGEVRGNIEVPDNVTLNTPPPESTTTSTTTTSSPTATPAFGTSSTSPGRVPSNATTSTPTTASPGTPTPAPTTMPAPSPVTPTASSSATSTSDDDSLTIDLLGENEIPPVSTDVTGQITFTLNTSDDGIPLLLYNLTLDNPSGKALLGVKGAHVHCGNATTNGPLMVILVPPIDGGVTDTQLRYEGSINQTSLMENNVDTNGTCGSSIDEVYDNVKNGQVYVNVHSEAHPDGEVRGQVVLEDATGETGTATGPSTDRGSSSSSSSLWSLYGGSEDASRWMPRLMSLFCAVVLCVL
jgi:hypothetical protein